jgi:shikimate kinase
MEMPIRNYYELMVFLKEFTTTKMRFFLIGFMGAGKSFWGQRLATHFDIPFVDLDTYIELQTQQTIATIFATKGEAAFRKLESASLRDVCHTYSTAIVACGGGTPCFEHGIDFMNEQGNTVYLRTSIDLLAKRISADTTTRPKLAQAAPADLTTHIETLLHQREKYYTQSQYSIDMNQDDDTIFATLTNLYVQTSFTSR